MVIVLLIADRDTDEVATLEGTLGIAVLHHDVVAFEEQFGEFGRGVLVGDFQTEEVCLGGDEIEVGDVLQECLETLTLGNELTACLLVVLLVLSEYLHVELSKGIDVPDGDVLTNPTDEFGVGRCQDSEPQAWDSIGFGDTLHHHQMGILGEDVVEQEGVVFEVVAEINKRLIDNELNFLFLGPLQETTQTLHRDKVARRD